MSGIAGSLPAEAARDPLLDPEERAATRLGWWGLAATGLTFAVFMAWSSFAPLAATAIADGVVKSDRNRRVVQHQEGGIVREIRVRDGQHVQAGDLLAVLDDAAVRADLRKVRGLLDSELARVARLEAERDGAARYTVPSELATRQGDANVSADLERERQAFTGRRAALQSQLALLARSMAESAAEAVALKRQVDEGGHAAARMQEEVAMNEALLKENFVQRTRVNALERTLHEYRMRQAEAQAQIAQAQQKRSELELRAHTLQADFVQAAHTELRASADRVEQLRAQLEPSTDAAHRQQILAPVSGRLVGWHLNTPGSVLAPRETLAEIVPDETPLVIEARLRTDAIAQIAAGTHAGVRLLAFDQRSTPTLDGRVMQVSADRQVDEQSGAAYYTMQVEVPDEALRDAGIGALTPGMPAEVFLHAGDRSALSYLIDPFTHRLERALRDK